MSARHAIPVFAALVLLVAPLRGQPAETTGKIDAVTVYRGQALVTRVIPLAGAAGLREIVVTALPEHVVPASLHAEGAGGVEVRSVRYRIRPVEQDVRAEVRALDEQICELQDRLTAAERQTQLIAERRTYLDRLEQFTATTASVELAQGVLNGDTLEKLSEYLLAQRRAHLEEELKLAREQRALREQLDVLGRQREVLTSGSARSQREAVVFAGVPEAGGELRLRYLVEHATWEPSYNIRADADRSGARVEYYAAIQQMSGEDWSDVSMTLSTASPTLTAKAPALTSLSIGLAPPQRADVSAPPDSGDYLQSRRELAQQQRQVESERAQHKGRSSQPRSAAASVPGDEELDVMLNRVAGQLQVLDLVAAGRVREGAARATAEGYSVVYAVAARTTLPSRADQQLIQIAALPMRGEFYKVAAPVLTSYVYEEANLVNDSMLVLLEGPVTTYVDGQFVGQSSIPNVAAGETFAVGFGIDSSLRAARELIDRKESTQGGNRVIDFKYRLVVENFGPAPATLRVVDRLPTSKGTDVKVTLVEEGRGLNKGPQVESERKQGLLRWDADVPAQATRDRALTVEYQFRLEYDRQMSIVGLATAN